MRLGYDASEDVYFVHLDNGERLFCRNPVTLNDCVEALEQRSVRREETLANVVALLLAATVIALGAVLASYCGVAGR